VGKRVTIQDVARAAQVSVATVSRVGTGSARVSPEVAERVRLAALKLGSDLVGRNRSKVIAFLLGNRDMLHLFHSHMLVGAESYCAARGWNMLFLTLRYPATAPWQELHLPPILARHDMVDGVILGGTNTPNLFDLLRRKAIPFAVLGNNVISAWRPEEHDVVWFDDLRGSFEMTRYLLSLGHRHIWFVGHTRLPWFSRRYEGYCRAMKEAGFPPHLSEIDSDNDQEVGYVATKALLGRGEPLHALQAGGDRVAEGAYKALRDSGLRVPDDVSVSGAMILRPECSIPPLPPFASLPSRWGSTWRRWCSNASSTPPFPRSSSLFHATDQAGIVPAARGNAGGNPGKVCRRIRIVAGAGRNALKVRRCIVGQYPMMPPCLYALVP